MDEEKFDSSKELYIEENETKYKSLKQEWDMAIGLQEVDNLKPSKYLEKLLDENIAGMKTVYEVEQELKQYYVDKDLNEKDIQEEYECDLVSTRIVKLLQEDNFELSVDYIKYAHKYLFEDIYDFAGQFRKVDIFKSKKEY